jgi:EAL domain-containing protein (putative c-di-GMP-specific phosphodiesterase class I)/CheY-like chemotaxis protein
MARSQMPDLILCDVVMPNMDGYDLLSALMADDQTRNIPFIFLSGNAMSQQDIRHGMRVGADDYLLKPVDLNDLIETIAIRLKKSVAHKSVLQQTRIDLTRAMEYNPVSGLPNATVLKRYYSDLVLPDKEGVTLALFQFERLSHIIEAYGNETADSVIRTSINHIEEVLGEEHRLFHDSPERLILVLRNVKTKDRAETELRSLLRTIDAEISCNGHLIHPSARVGYVVCSGELPEDVAVLVHRADTALNWARDKNSGPCQAYTDDMSVSSAHRVTLEGQLLTALESGQLRVFYQPQVRVADGSIAGMEALIRWIHPDQGMISPLQFIPIAEETGMIVPIGEWVLKEACNTVAQWTLRYNRPLRLSVNVSGRQFTDSLVAETVERAVTQTGFPASQLDLEITESYLARNPARMHEQLMYLKQLGVGIAIDDFGTEYSSFSYLTQFPVTILKIDRAFIKSIATDEATRNVVAGIVHTARGLSLEIIAEGIETVEQLEIIHDLGVDYYQGFLFAKPVPPDEFVGFLQTSAA